MPFAFVAVSAVLLGVAAGRRAVSQVAAYSAFGLLVGGLIRIGAGVP